VSVQTSSEGVDAAAIFSVPIHEAAMAQSIESDTPLSNQVPVASSQNSGAETKIETIFLNSAEAATLIGLQPCTLAAWRCLRTDGPPFVKIGSAVRYNRAALLDWAQARTHRSTETSNGLNR